MTSPVSDVVLIILIASAFIFGTLISILVNMLIYKKELKDTIEGTVKIRKYQVESTFWTSEIHQKQIERILQLIERNIKDKMTIWKKGERSYCGFLGIFSGLQIKCLVTVTNSSESRFRLNFAFFAKHTTPVMMRIFKSKYKRRIEKLFIELTDGMCDGIVGELET